MEKVIKTEKITEYLIKTGYSQGEFCKLCKVSTATFQKIMQQDCNFGVKALFRIARQMEIRVCDLLV